ncbi:MAG: hypothetical protein NC098_02225 [Lachnoclostridium sp.]|nr:hypothetical protein [Lachnoclostridium sp.]
MKLWEKRLASFFRTKAASFLLISGAAAMIVMSHDQGAAQVAILSSPHSITADPLSLIPPAISGWINMAMLVLVMLMLVYINRRFNVMRSQLTIYTGLFLLLTAANPPLSSTFTASTLLAIALLYTMVLYYTVYNLRRQIRPVYLGAFVVGSVGLISYPAFLYIPVLLMMLIQSRVFSLRSIAAVLFGALTPIWIAWGFGWLDTDLRLHFYLVNPRLLISTPEWTQLTITAAATLLIGFFTGFSVLLKVMTFNARSRMLNGMMTLLASFSGLFMIINYENILLYMTILNATVAFQTAYYLRLRKGRSGYLMVIFVILTSITLYFRAVS